MSKKMKNTNFINPIKINKGRAFPIKSAMNRHLLLTSEKCQKKIL